MSDGLTRLNMREPESYTRDEIAALKTRVRILETQEPTVIGNTRLADMPQATVKGRALGAGTGDPQDLTATQMNAIAGTDDLIMTAGQYLHSQRVRAIDAGGIRVEDDSGTLGLTVEDGGKITVGNITVADAGSDIERLTVRDGLRIVSGAPALRWRDIGATLPLGLWQARLVSDVWRLEKNTHVSGDFSTVITPIAIDADGKVGIGTTAPTQRLDVVHNSSPAIAVYDNSSVGPDKGGRLLLQHNNAGGSRITYAAVRSSAQDGTVGGEDGDLVFEAMRNNVLTEAGRFRGNTGRFGVGTNSPQTLLQVGDGADASEGSTSTLIMAQRAGTTYITGRNSSADVEVFMGATGATGQFGTMTAHPLLFVADFTEWMRLTTAGFLGIATNNPAANLHVVDTRTSGVTVLIDNTATDGDPTLTFRLPGVRAWNMGINDGDSDKFMISYDNSSTLDASVAMTMTTAGLVGIGTTSPQGRFHVHDGTGGSMHVSKTGVAGTAVVIIPDGTGDVVRRLYITGIVRSTDNVYVDIINTSIAPSGTANMPLGGADILTFAVSAAGQLTVQRTGGTKTYDCTLFLTWM